MLDSSFNRSIFLSAFIKKNEPITESVMTEIDYLRNYNLAPKPSTSYFHRERKRIQNLMNFFKEFDIDYSVVWKCVEIDIIEVYIIFNETTQTMLVLKFGSNDYFIEAYVSGSLTDVGKIVL